MSDSLRPCGLQPIRLLSLWNSPGKSSRVGCHFLLQGIFLTQGLNPGLLHCRQILYHLSHQGSPYCEALIHIPTTTPLHPSPSCCWTRGFQAPCSTYVSLQFSQRTKRSLFQLCILRTFLFPVIITHTHYFSSPEQVKTSLSGKGGRKKAKPFKNISQKDSVLVTGNSLQGCRQSLSIVKRQRERRRNRRRKKREARRKRRKRTDLNPLRWDTNRPGESK